MLQVSRTQQQRANVQPQFTDSHSIATRLPSPVLDAVPCCAVLCVLPYSEDVREAREFLDSVGLQSCRVLAKIETRQSLLNFRGILATADGIIVSRWASRANKCVVVLSPGTIILQVWTSGLGSLHHSVGCCYFQRDTCAALCCAVLLGCAQTQGQHWS